MNIFKILSSGDGKVYEPSITAFFSYLLNPYEGHGLSFNLFNPIVKLILDKDFDGIKIEDHEIKVESEVIVESKNKENLKINKNRRDIDVLICISNRKIVKILIFIELKISAGSYNKEQIEDQILIAKNSNQFNFIKSGEFVFKESEIESNDIKKINVVIAPDEIGKKIKHDEDIMQSLKFITWMDVSKIIEEELQKESRGEIEPIYDFVKHILRSFNQFIKSNFKSYVEAKAENRQKNNYGKPILSYLRDIYENEEFWNNQNITKVSLKKKLKELVENNSGVELDDGTANCQIDIATVNKKSRLNYGYFRTLDDIERNLFIYYKDNKTYKRTKDLKEDEYDNIDVYYKEDDNVKIVKLTKDLIPSFKK